MQSNHFFDTTKPGQVCCKPLPWVPPTLGRGSKLSIQIFILWSVSAKLHFKRKHHTQTNTTNIPPIYHRYTTDILPGQYHRVHAPGLHHDNAPGVTHRWVLYEQEVFLMIYMWVLHEEDQCLSYDADAKYFWFNPTISDELYFLWNPFWSVDYPLNPEDSIMSSTLLQMWTDFAK